MAPQAQKGKGKRPAKRAQPLASNVDGQGAQAQAEEMGAQAHPPARELAGQGAQNQAEEAVQMRALEQAEGQEDEEAQLALLETCMARLKALERQRGAGHERGPAPQPPPGGQQQEERARKRARIMEVLKDMSSRLAALEGGDAQLDVDGGTMMAAGGEQSTARGSAGARERSASAPGSEDRPRARQDTEASSSEDHNV